MANRQVTLPHPGEILQEEFLEPLGLSAYACAKRLDVPLTRITAILAGTRGVTADTALRLGRVFGTSAEFWMNLQTQHELQAAEVDLQALEPLIELAAAHNIPVNEEHASALAGATIDNARWVFITGAPSRAGGAFA